MSKKKSAENSFSDISFVSSLPLEEAVRLIGGLASHELQVTLTEVNGGEYWRFDMHRRVRGTLSSAGVRGTTRRWQGTYTRLDCETYTSIMTVNIAKRWAIFNLMVSVPLVLLIMFSRVLSAGFNPLWLASMTILLALWGGWFIYVLMFFGESRHVESEDKMMPFRYNADTLLTGLVNVFKSAGDVSLDGANLNPDNDPGVDAALKSMPVEHASQRRSR